MQGYVAGLNAAFRKQGTLVTPYTARDVVAVGALLAARFGANGGSETRRSMFLDALQERAGRDQGAARSSTTSARPTTSSPRSSPPARFRTTCRRRRRPAASSSTTGASRPSRVSPATPSFESRPASNALLVSAKRSKSGHPGARRRAAGGLLLPAVLHGGRPAWRRLRRPRRSPARPAARPRRAWPGLRLDGHVLAGGQHRRLRRDASAAATIVTTCTGAPAAR